MPAPLIAGNSRGFTEVSRGVAEDGAVDEAAPTAGTIPNTSMVGVMVSIRLLLSASWPRVSMMYLKNSYVDQQIAVAGIEYNTLGNIPLKNPRTPAVSWI